MKLSALARGAALSLILSIGLSMAAGAVDYQFPGVSPPAYYQSTEYELTYGSRYNYGGPNVADYRVPELAYGLGTQPGIGTAEVVKLTVSPQAGGAGSVSGGGGSGDQTADAGIAYGIAGGSGDASPAEIACGILDGGVTSAVPILPAEAVSDSGFTVVSPARTAYTSIDGMKRSDGSIGTVKIPSLGINMKVWEGETNASMAKGLGHYSSTSAWDGNVAVCGHNRGAKYMIGSIISLDYGDQITYTTVYGTRHYTVVWAGTISNDDWSRLQATADNRITITTCLADQPSRRVCVQAVESC